MLSKILLLFLIGSYFHIIILNRENLTYNMGVFHTTKAFWENKYIVAGGKTTKTLKNFDDVNFCYRQYLFISTNCDNTKKCYSA
jgi:hypothetical protein